VLVRGKDQLPGEGGAIARFALTQPRRLASHRAPSPSGLPSDQLKPLQFWGRNRLGAHDQADRDAGDHDALSMGASERGAGPPLRLR
jgi:hypothetical protein